MLRPVCMLMFLLIGPAAADALEICGNPCEEGYVWNDRNMGMCVPAPPEPATPETPQPTS